MHYLAKLLHKRFWLGGKISTSGQEGYRFETRFRQRSATHVSLNLASMCHMSARWCDSEARRGMLIQVSSSYLTVDQYYVIHPETVLMSFQTGASA
ncbi:hypothetical protein AVEN_8559-1 [Araneus ventricosus]|uniref:Uncharacterized protein n=1 Tax=Araneus ventricosus TaxID=182803 RepID=A0A4Y2GLP6_ARAVE|nr:hypothetical protein AVEN_8559-1 [Araneus ventricosus]